MNLSVQFKDYLLSQSHPASKATVKNYISDVNRFVSWFEFKFNKQFSPENVSYEIIESFRSESLGTHSASSVERNISSLRKFFSFLKLDSKISHSPFEAGTQRSAETDFDTWKIRDFKNYLYVLNASNLTIKNYIIDVKQFKNWIEFTVPEANFSAIEANLILNSLDSRLINDYKNRLLNDLHFSPVSVNRKLSSLRKYISWATEQGLIRGDIQVTSETRLSSEISIPEAAILSSTETEPSPKAYSKFPPLRLMQKSGAGLGLLLDAAIIAPIALTMNQLDHAFWVMKGKPVFDAGKKALSYSILEPLEKASKPVTNIPKSFYAPTHISTADFPIHRKIWHNARYTRPDWYRKYHSYTFTSYLHFSILLMAILLSAYTLVKNQALNTHNTAVLAGLPSAPARVLSFQGRITDVSGTAIDKDTNLRIAIYNNEKASGSALLWQEIVSAKPDTDGIFNVLLGKNVPIPQSLFAQNSALWLGVTVEKTDELTPRQPIATVAYAANSETLQGYPLITAGANSANVVLALNSSGNLTMGGSPTFQATGGTFTLSGRALLLTTAASGNGNITLAPNGNGVIDLQKVIQNTSNNGSIIPGSVQVSDTLLVNASSPSQAALYIGQSSTGDLIVASTSSVTKFRVNNAGNITAGSYNGLTVSSGTITSGTWNGAQIGSTYGGTGIDTSASTGVPFISTGTWSIDSNSLAPNHGGTGLNSYTTGDILYAGSSNSLNTLGIGGNGECLTSDGSIPSWSLCSGGGSPSSPSVFTETLGSIIPNNSTEDFLIGGQSTDSAKFAIINVNGARGTQTASISGGVSLDSDSASIGTANFQTLTLGGSTTGGLVLDSGNSSITISDDTFIAGTLVTSGPINANGGINVSSGASISDSTSFAGLVVDELGAGDIFTASNSGTTKFTITNSGAVFANNLTNTNQANTVCYNTSSGEITYNSGSGCTSSSIRYKHDVTPLNDSLALLMRLAPVSFKYNENYQPDGRTHVGFIAEEVNQIDPRLVDFESDGVTPSGVQYANITALLTQGVQQQQLQIEDKQTRLNSLETDLAITDSGNLSINPVSDSNFEVRRGAIRIDRIGAFSEAFIGKLKGGYFELGRLTVNIANIAFAQIENLSVNSLAVASENITIAGENIRDYIYSIVDARVSQKQIAIASPILETDIIKPSGHKLTIKLPTNDKASKVEVLNASNSAVASIDAQGNASFSGQLSSNGLETTEASVAGTLKAGRIVADQLDLSAEALNKLQGSIASSAGVTNNYYYSSDTPASIAGTGTGSANLASITARTGTFINGLMSFGETSFYEASIANRLFVGAQLTIADHSINVLGDSLQIQPLAQGGVDFEAGKVVIDTDGNLKVNGNAYFAKNVEVNGNLFAGIIAPIPGKDLIFQFKDESDSAIEFKTGTNSAVLSFNNKGDIKASGSGTFNKLNLSFVPKAIAVSDTEVIATGSAGTAEIKPYQNELTIKNPSVTKDSLIYITPKTGTPNQSVYLLRQVPGESFTVGLSKVISKAVPFNWIIIN